MIDGTWAVSIEDAIVGGFASFCVAAASLGCVYLFLSWIFLMRQPAAGAARARVHPPVSVLKPLHGAEPALLACLRSFCRQDYPAPIQIIFGVQERDDPAIQVVEQIRQEFPDADITLHIDARVHGTNRKMSNVCNIAALARYDVIVLADSDIDVAPDHLARIAAELEQPEVGAVTCLYHGIRNGTLWSRLSALAINSHFLPNVITALALKLARPCFGSTIALRRETLKEIGGFAAFADDLADDYELGEAVRAIGRQVAIPAYSVGHACSPDNPADMLREELRYARTIKIVDPIGHVGALITHPLPWSLLAVAAGSTHAAIITASALILRLLVVRAVERAFGLPREAAWLLPVRDLISFGVFVTSFFGGAVNWRGHKYHVLPDGALVQDPS
jgi:ceramide glucosyltransferase